MTATPDDLADLETVNRLTAEIAAVGLRIDNLRGDFAWQVSKMEEYRNDLLAQLTAAGQRIQDRAEREGWASE